jgi:hypothetical protein
MAAVPTGDRWAQATAAALLLVALAFGGGLSGRGDLMVQALAVLALGVAIARWRWGALGPAQKAMAWLLAAACAVAALQLVPLPVAVFERLPGRAPLVAELHAAGLRPAWLAMSLDGWATLRALLALVAFSAMWMLCTTLSMDARVRLLKLAVLAALPLALLGFAQASMKRDTTGANALFANRNHFATLMAMLLPLAFAAAREARARRLPGGAAPWLACAVILLLGAAMSFSRTGFLLACLATVAVLVAQATLRGRQAEGGGANAPGGIAGAGPGAWAALALAAAGIGYFAMDRLGARFASDVAEDLRWTLFSQSWPLLQAWWPWGSGLGSFATVHGAAEPLQALGQYVAAPYAHDELLQLAIEAGLPGLVLAGAFLAEVAVVVASAFGRSRPGGEWRLAAAIAVLVPLLHSLVDYPLRTLACSLLLALLLSLGLQPPRGSVPNGRP